MTVVLTHAGGQTDIAAASRLLVTRRDPNTRMYSPLGFLTRDGSGSYRFAYLRVAAESGARPLPGLPDARTTYRSERLFPIFAERVMSSRRPDRQASLEALGLGLDAAPFEVLQRSGGLRVGDTIELLPAPVADAGDHVQCEFLVHGVRYMSREAQARIGRLSEGEVLRLVRDPQNPVQPRALLVTDCDELALGYVPDPLLDMVDRITGIGVSVVRANGPEVGFHQRLLVQVSGVVAATLFSGAEWETSESAA